MPTVFTKKYEIDHMPLIRDEEDQEHLMTPSTEIA